MESVKNNVRGRFNYPIVIACSYSKMAAGVVTHHTKEVTHECQARGVPNDVAGVAMGRVKLINQEEL